MSNEHTTTCTECGTIHVCPGKPVKSGLTTVDQVRQALEGALVRHVETYPYIKGIFRFNVDLEGRLGFLRRYEWLVGEQNSSEVHQLLMKAFFR